MNHGLKAKSEKQQKNENYSDKEQATRDEEQVIRNQKSECIIQNSAKKT
jgi:hypothetical protein